MKEISVKVDDDLYRQAARQISDLEQEINNHVTEYLESMNGEEDVPAARTRMANLFAKTKNFSVGVRPTREEMHEG